MLHKNYDPIHWLLWLRELPRENLFSRLKPFFIWIIGYAVIIGFLDFKYELVPRTTNLGQFHLLFSFCLSIVVGFRINTAYNRWWEGRGHWGALVNHSRSLALKLQILVNLQKDPALKQYLLAFPWVLKSHLRGKREEGLKILQLLGLPVSSEDHLPNLLLTHIYHKLITYRQAGKISWEQYLALDSHVTAFVDILGACEKILNTSPPLGFSLLTRCSLLFYMIIFPFGWVHYFGFFVIPILMIIVYTLLGLEVLAEEIEQPFGEDANDLPLEAISKTIERNIHQIALLKLPTSRKSSPKSSRSLPKP